MVLCGQCRWCELGITLPPTTPELQSSHRLVVVVVVTGERVSVAKIALPNRPMNGLVVTFVHEQRERCSSGASRPRYDILISVQSMCISDYVRCPRRFLNI